MVYLERWQSSMSIHFTAGILSGLANGGNTKKKFTDWIHAIWVIKTPFHCQPFLLPTYKLKVRTRDSLDVVFNTSANTRTGSSVQVSRWHIYNLEKKVLETTSSVLRIIIRRLCSRCDVIRETCLFIIVMNWKPPKSVKESFKVCV